MAGSGVLRGMVCLVSVVKTFSFRYGVRRSWSLGAGFFLLPFGGEATVYVLHVSRYRATSRSLTRTHRPIR